MIKDLRDTYFFLEIARLAGGHPHLAAIRNAAMSALEEFNAGLTAPPAPQPSTSAPVRTI